jgi:hypothetical protein
MRNEEGKMVNGEGGRRGMAKEGRNDKEGKKDRRAWRASSGLQA